MDAHETHPLTELKERIGRALELFYDRIGRHHHGVAGHVAEERPPAEVSERQGGLTVTLELPGMDADDVEVVASEGALTVRGEKRLARDEDGESYVLRERAYGSFERRFAVPSHLDPEAATASFKNGVLTVTVPRKPDSEAQEKRITIKSG